jgi:hypothetical protein
MSFGISTKLEGIFHDLETDENGNFALIGRNKGKPVLQFCDSLFNEIKANQIDTSGYENTSVEPSDDYVSENKNKSNFSENDFSDMILKNLFSPYKGRIIAVAEKKFTEQICNTLPVRYGGMQCINFYYNYHIYLFDLDIRNNTIKNYKLEKKQGTQDDFGIYNSFVTISDSLSSMFIFNDDLDNYKSQRKKRVSMSYPNRSVITAYRFNFYNNTSENYLVDKNQERQTIIKPGSIYQTEMNVCYLISSRKNTFRITKISK